MAPEILAGLVHSYAMDMYSLGVVLFMVRYNLSWVDVDRAAAAALSESHHETIVAMLSPMPESNEKSLVLLLLSANPEDRPMAEVILMSPMFWNCAAEATKGVKEHASTVQLRAEEYDGGKFAAAVARIHSPGPLEAGLGALRGYASALVSSLRRCVHRPLRSPGLSPVKPASAEVPGLSVSISGDLAIPSVAAAAPYVGTIVEGVTHASMAAFLDHGASCGLVDPPACVDGSTAVDAPTLAATTRPSPTDDTSTSVPSIVCHGEGEDQRSDAGGQGVDEAVSSGGAQAYTACVVSGLRYVCAGHMRALRLLAAAKERARNFLFSDRQAMSSDRPFAATGSGSDLHPLAVAVAL